MWMDGSEENVGEGRRDGWRRGELRVGFKRILLDTCMTIPISIGIVLHVSVERRVSELRPTGPSRLPIKDTHCNLNQSETSGTPWERALASRLVCRKNIGIFFAPSRFPPLPFLYWLTLLLYSCDQ
jgi:hypothetical protein